MLAPGQTFEIPLFPQQQPIIITDPFRPWMKGHVWIFDHPYFALTQEDGRFSFPQAPAGHEIRIWAWHEAKGKFYTKDIVLNAGENAVEMMIQADKKTP